MSLTGWIMLGACVLLGIVGSALYSGLETGLYTLSRVRLDVRASEGHGAARTLKRLVDRPTLMLATLLLANNICNYLSSYGIAGLLDASGFSAVEGVIINAAILVPLLFIFGEVLPKDLFRVNTERWSYACARLLDGTRRLLSWVGLVPIVTAVGGRLGRHDASVVTSRQRVANLLREGVSVGVLTESQTMLVDRTLLLRERPVTDEMVPWDGVVTLPRAATRAHCLSLVSEHDHTRFPVVGDDGRVVGIVSVLDLMLHPDSTLEKLTAAPLRLPSTLRVQEALARLRDHRASVAIIEDDGVPRGLVTMKDLVEVLVGELTAW